MTLTERMLRIADGVNELADEVARNSEVPEGGFYSAYESVGYAAPWRPRRAGRKFVKTRGPYGRYVEVPFPYCGCYGVLSLFMMFFAFSPQGVQAAEKLLAPEAYRARRRRIEYEEERSARNSCVIDDTSDFSTPLPHRGSTPSHGSGHGYEDPALERDRAMADYIDRRRTREWYEGNDDPL